MRSKTSSRRGPSGASGHAELGVNRRERTQRGETILGWNPDNLVDNQVTSLQFRRPDESVIATAVGFGCHPVTTGFDMYVYSADFPGAMREFIRRNTHGEAVFLQGAGGNVLPKVAFTEDEQEAVDMGTRLGLEALHSLAGRFAWRRRMESKSERSVMQISAYRRAVAEQEPAPLAATARRVRFPLLTLAERPRHPRRACRMGPEAPGGTSRRRRGSSADRLLARRVGEEGRMHADRRHCPDLS